MQIFRTISSRWMLPLLLIGIISVIYYPGLASAHATVTSSSPAANEILESPPEGVSITFNESIEQAFYSVIVTGPDGRRADQGDAAIDSERSDRLAASLKNDLPNGIYSIKWKAVSSDGHAISGTIPFGIGTDGSGYAVHTSAGDDNALPRAGLIIIRWLFYIGLSLCIGTIFFRLLLLPAGAQALRGSSLLEQRSLLLLYMGLVCTVVGVLFSLPQQTASDAGVSWIQAWDLDLLQETLRFTSFGQVWTWQVIQVILLAVFIMGLCYTISGAGQDGPHDSSMKLMDKDHHKASDRSTSRFIGQEHMWSWLVLIACIGLMVAKAFIGHAATTSHKLMAISADFIHLLTAVIWLGGILSIAFLLPAVRRLTEQSGSLRPLYWGTIRRFSLLASLCVLMLLLTGVYGGILHIPTLHALWNTPYGIVLLAKFALMLIMLAFALSAFLRGRRSTRPLGRGVWYEFCLGAVVLVLAAVLGNLPSASSTPGPVSLQATTEDGYRITLSVSPNRLGENHFSLEIQDSSGTKLNNIEQASISLTSREMDMGVIQIEMPGSSPLEADEMITMGGEWNVRIHILLSTLDSIDHDFILQSGN
ncbi:copper resistance protein CopC [Paenibacillus motobuensis]|uniref:copper resistance CopC/CopD family protein n=1 Tax=Paenibacillus TaxID=44249 RepID=UPI00203AF95D|nr:copper resistance protein CopC [Paenibacillus lutimineralis]MCM3649827.1 copper resistance protein CopC [Paenibacillus motobuensis]